MNQTCGSSSAQLGVASPRPSLQPLATLHITIDATRAQGPVGFGEDQPVDTNRTNACRAANRRVEFITRSADSRN